MGSCCIIDSNLIAEQLIRYVLKDESLTIRNYNYTELFNEIVSKGVEKEISKEHLKQFLEPLFFDANKTQSNYIYIESIFNCILDHLEEKDNLYIVLLYFYPFIKHEGEKIENNFFNIIRILTQTPGLDISREKVRKCLFDYILFCSWGITNAIRIKLPPSDDLNISFISLIKGTYAEDKIYRFLERLMKELTMDKSEKLITLEMFQNMFKKYDISEVEKVRDYLLTEE
jgi:hypothetical protein